MGIFDRLRQTKSATKAMAPDEKPKKEAVSAVASSDVAKASGDTGHHAANVLLTPWVSEKASVLAARGTYAFRVPISANKIEVHKAVQAVYGVNVTGVRMIRGIGKQMTRGRIHGRRVNWKKALVTLKKGQTIDLYQGV